MPGQSLQPPGHIQQQADLLIALVERLHLLVFLESLIDGDIQLIRDHLGHRIAERVRQVHRPAHISDDALGRHGSEGDDLGHVLLPVFGDHIVDDLTAALEAEVHVNIGHGHALGVQEPLEQQLVADGIELRDPQAVRDQRTGGGAAPRADHDPMSPRIVDEVPDDQEILHISHLLYNAQLIVKPLPELIRHRIVALLKPFPAQLVQVFPGRIWRGHIVNGQLGDAEFDLDIAPFGDLYRIFQRLRGIGKKRRHLLRRL